MLPRKKKAKLSPLAFLDSYTFVRQTVVDKIYGCIIDSALGDTIGLYTEFLTKAKSEKIYKDRKFQLVQPATKLYPDGHRKFAPCVWTDDTDQALLIILSYLYNYTHVLANTPTKTDSTASASNSLGKDFAARLQIWISQGLLALDRHACGIGALVGSVVDDVKYVGNPTEIATRKWIKTKRKAAPNGSLMRTHPIGVIGVGMSEE
ncbi:hypothetical protein CC86DRAFT_411554 [Ophiobolus disseminans]|uniref:Uncharacterized protein n=1 Tax=Ophiobolus disseminans TaxID=1469910 RepID=A0A6A6ZLY8_9PLEO|nr:hypothetical protein CC86DRAFT_411554 [Ophiobolus disseminans]